MSKFGILLLSVLLTNPSAPLYAAPALTETQRAYFFRLYQETWNYLDTSVESLTGVPYDSSARQPPTSLSNAGYFLAAASVASQTGLISKGEALQRIQRLLEAVEKIETWRNFPRPWFLVRSLKPAFGDEFSYAPHLSVFIGGLVVVKNTFPELKNPIDQMLVRMRFDDLYDPKTGWLKGGYNVQTQNFAFFQPWGHWYYKHFASESRLLSFYAIASQQVPAHHWQTLLRPVQTKEGETFFVSGYEEAGLGPQYVTGLFLDERQTEIGNSQKNYAESQIKYAEKIGAPVWGWSACEAPDRRYLGSGEMRDEIVTPYASVLAALYFPEEAYKNLKELERVGARPAGEGFGFRDSVNWKTGEIAPHYLTPSAGMTFLSLANLLFDGVVWNTFQSDPVVRRGMRTLGSETEEPGRF